MANQVFQHKHSPSRLARSIQWPRCMHISTQFYFPSTEPTAGLVQAIAPLCPTRATLLMVRDLLRPNLFVLAGTSLCNVCSCRNIEIAIATAWAIIGGIYWGRSNAIFALIQYAEAEKALSQNATEFQRVAALVKNYCCCMAKMLTITPLQVWSASRWIDMALSVAWAIWHASPTHTEVEVLMSLFDTLKTQGVDWGAHFAGIGRAELSDSQQLRHNVNNAQALKWSAVEYLFTGNTSLRRAGLADMANMDAMMGLPTGLFNGDELIPKPPTRNPSRGIETCGVVRRVTP
eukprot:COSAG01_NODE_1119_length_11633_cov_4.612190_5_plen_290_part_00